MEPICLSGHSRRTIARLITVFNPMPITLPILNRRDWLKHAMVGTLAIHSQAAETPEQVWVLFSDPHIDADDKAVSREVCVAENLTRCVNQVLKIWRSGGHSESPRNRCAVFLVVVGGVATFS